MFEAKIILVLLAVMALMSAGGYYYYNYSQGKIQAEQAKVVQLNIANQAAEKHIELMKEDAAKQKKISDELDTKFAASRKEIEEMRARFSGKNKNGTDKNLGKAAIEKPLIIQNAANRVTAEQMRCLELESGAHLTEGEKNGTTKNDVCPELANPNQPK